MRTTTPQGARRAWGWYPTLVTPGVWRVYVRIYGISTRVWVAVAEEVEMPESGHGEHLLQLIFLHSSVARSVRSDAQCRPPQEESYLSLWIPCVSSSISCDTIENRQNLGGGVLRVAPKHRDQVSSRSRQLRYLAINVELYCDRTP